MSAESIKVDFFFSIKDSNGKEVGDDEPGDYYFTPYDSETRDWYWGMSNFAKRSKIVEALVNGTLTIEVRMRKHEQSNTPDAFIPENPLCKNILAAFMDEESADVMFEVGNGSQQGGNTLKRARTAPTRFYAHRFIMQKSSSTLADLCKSGQLSITDVKPDIFRHMLYYMYGGKLSDRDWNGNAKDLIDAADKYGVVSLKLEAEAFYFKSTKLTIDNILDNLLYADSKNCALLKEAVMDFILKNSDDVMDKVSFDDVPGSTVKDLLAAVKRGKKEEGGGSSVDPRNFNTMRVGTLRRMLCEKGLEVDGSREAMISLLKKNSIDEDGENAEDDGVDGDENNA
jgi:hypothetical protein